MPTSNQQTELEKPVTRAVYFVELDFSSDVQRISTAMQTISWGGFDWIGLGSVLDISPVEEEEGLTPRALNFSINIAQPSWLALAIGPTGEYSGRYAKLYLCPLNEQFQLVDTPELCWTGNMQTITVTADQDGAQAVLTCETSAFDLKRSSGLRLNDVQHKKKYPSDLGFEYQADLKRKPQTWLSKRFQQV